jgi:hypothetical protein
MLGTHSRPREVEGGRLDPAARNDNTGHVVSCMIYVPDNSLVL